MKKTKKTNVISLCAYRKKKQAHALKKDSTLQQQKVPSKNSSTQVYYMENYLKTKTPPSKDFESSKMQTQPSSKSNLKTNDFFIKKEESSTKKLKNNVININDYMIPSYNDERPQEEKESMPLASSTKKAKVINLDDYRKNKYPFKQDESFSYSSKVSTMVKALPYAMMAGLMMVFSLNVFIPSQEGTSDRGIASQKSDYRVRTSGPDPHQPLSPHQYIKDLKKMKFEKVIIGVPPSSKD